MPNAYVVLKRQSSSLLSMAGILMSILALLGILSVLKSSLPNQYWNLLWLLAVMPPAWAAIEIFRSTTSIELDMLAGHLTCRTALGIRRQFTLIELHTIQWRSRVFADIICIGIGSNTIRLLAVPDSAIVEWQQIIERHCATDKPSIISNLCNAARQPKFTLLISSDLDTTE